MLQTCRNDNSQHSLFTIHDSLFTTMEAQNGGSPVSFDGQAQAQHPADYEARMAAALDLYTQDPAAATERFPEFREHFRMSTGRENAAGEETL